LAPEVLRYAHTLDANLEPAEMHDGSQAYRTAEDVETNKPVNVASVPQRLPQTPPKIKNMNTNEKLAELRGLQAKADAIRKELGFNITGKVIFLEPLDVCSDAEVVVEADGFGGAKTTVVEGHYPIDYVNKFERYFASESEAEGAADDLASHRATPSQILEALA